MNEWKCYADKSNLMKLEQEIQRSGIKSKAMNHRLVAAKAQVDVLREQIESLQSENSTLKEEVGRLREVLGTSLLDHDNIYRKAVKLWGVDSELGMAVEECAELIVAIQHTFRTTRHFELSTLIEEIADVLIVCNQLRYIVGSNNVDKEITRKLERLSQRINGEKEALNPSGKGG